jgi:ribonucleotide reductase beta subunit family protein with ferritin-like domain/glutaredoxin
MSLTQASETYYPVYSEFVEITEEHEKIHWGTWEVSLKDDVMQWQTGVIPEKTKAFIKTILRIFTEGDRVVGADYYDHLIPVFKNNEVRNMLGSFANREGTHQRAYALLNDTLGFGKDFYTEFKQYQQMQEKLEFMQDLNHGSMRDVALSLGKQCYIEGVSLFASFAMLLNFGRQGILPGMTDINTWSIREETLHIRGNSLLFRKFLEEHPRIVTDDFKKELYDICRKCVEIEDAFIDLAFDTGAVEGITREEVKQYVRAVADFRSVQIGLKQQYNVANPFPWLDWITSSTGMENFFEVNTTNYSKGSMVGSYDAAYAKYRKAPDVTIWSKNGCPYCNEAKTLLVAKGFNFTEYNIDTNSTRDDFLSANPDARTFPQIWFDKELVGGYTDLVKHLNGV